MKLYRRHLRDQRKDLNEAHAKSMFVSDGAEVFQSIDHVGDKLLERLWRHLEAKGDKIGLDILDDMKRLDDVEDKVVKYMNDKATTQRPFIQRATQLGEKVLTALRGRE